MDLIFFDDHYTRMEPLRALLDTGASLNFISEEKARVVGLILLPHLGQDIELANGHRIRPRYNVSARWRPFRNSGTIWTDRFVVLSEMGGRDVIIGSEILENRLFLLGKNELNVLGLPKLSKRELQEQNREQKIQQQKNQEMMMQEEEEMKRKERERRAAAKKDKKPRKERQHSPGSAEEEVYHSSREM